MSVLCQKLEQASKQFTSHNFQQALHCYEQCLEFAESTDEPDHVIFNIMSSKGSLECILGDYDRALQTLNTIIRSVPTHFLALLRRSQVYKKMNKLLKAEKDLNKIVVYCPDNLQVVAMLSQVQSMLTKAKKDDMPNETASSDDEEDEQAMLNFVNLKKIDRPSISIRLAASSHKKDGKRVTLLGDKTEYYIKQDDDEDNNMKKLSEDQVQKKLQQTMKEIQADGQDEKLQIAPSIFSISGNSKKSIIRNKNTSIFIQPETKESKHDRYLNSGCNLVGKVKSIDGKIVKSRDEDEMSKREVDFKKGGVSVLGQGEIKEEESQNINRFLHTKSTTVTETDQLRKSCLKRSSLQMPKFISEQGLVRRGSKLQSLNKYKIDGQFIKNKPRKSLTKITPQMLKGIQGAESEQSNDDEQHNVFGNKPVVLSKQMKETLGLKDEGDEMLSVPKTRSASCKSILKKNSFLGKLPLLAKKTQSVLQQGKKKKSVMFTSMP